MTDENLHDSTDQLVEDLFAEQAEEGRANDDSFADEQDTHKGDQVNDKPISQLAEVNKQKQVEVWSNRILSGEADLSDLPKDKAWLKPLISRKIEQQETNLNVEALLEKKLAEREAKARKEQELKEFSVFKSEIAELDSEEKEIINAKRKILISKGLSPIEALKEAFDYYKVASRANEVTRQELRKNLSLPAIKPKADTKTDLVDYTSPDFHNKGTSRDRIAAMEARLGNKRFQK
jgi:hypothetical protein